MPHYIQRVLARHIYAKIVKYGTLALASNQSTEYFIGEVKRFILRMSRRGGCDASLANLILLGIRRACTPC
jgi:hypothetical protein